MTRLYNGHQRASSNSLTLTVYWTVFILCKEWVSAYPNSDIDTLSPNDFEGTFTEGQVRDRRQSSPNSINGQQFETSNVKGIGRHLRSVGVSSNPGSEGSKAVYMDFKGKALPPKPPAGRGVKPQGGRTAKPQGGRAVKPQGGRSVKPQGGRSVKPKGGRSVKPQGGRSVNPKGGRSAKPQAGRGAKKEAYPRIDFQVKEDDAKGRGVNGRSAKKEAYPRIDFQVKEDDKKSGTPVGRGIDGRSAKKEIYPRIDFQVKEDVGKGGTTGGRGIDGRSAKKEIYPRIDFQVREDDGKGGTPGGRGIDGRSAKKEIYPTIDFQVKEDVGKGGTPGGRGIDGRSAKKDIYPRIDFQVKEDDGKGGIAGRGIDGRSAKKEVYPRIDFQVKEDSVSAAGRYVQSKGRGIPVAPTATTQPQEGDGKITITFKNSKITDIQMTGDMENKLSTGTLVLKNRTENGQVVYYLDVVQDASTAAHKLLGMNVNSNDRNLGGNDDLVTEEAFVHEFDPDKLPVYVIIRNKPGEEPKYYGKIDRQGTGRVLLPSTADEVRAEGHHIFELLGNKGRVSHIVPAQKRGQSRALTADESDNKAANKKTMDSGEESDEDEESGEDSKEEPKGKSSKNNKGFRSSSSPDGIGKAHSKTSSHNSKGSRGLGGSTDIAENREGKLSEGQNSKNPEHGLGGDGINSDDSARKSSNSPGLGNDSKNFDVDRNKTGNFDLGNEAGSRSLVRTNSDKNSDNNTGGTPTENASAVQRTSRSVSPDNEDVKASDMADDELFQLDPDPVHVGKGSNSSASNDTEWPFDDDFGAKQHTFENTTGSSIVFDN